MRVYPGNERRVLEAAVRGRFRSITSPAILDELGKVLIRLGVGEREVEGYLVRIMEVSEAHLPRGWMKPRFGIEETSRFWSAPVQGHPTTS